MAWKRWNRSLYARPQAWWTPIGLLAVIGPSRKLQCGPPAFRARRRSNVRRSRHSARISCSCATRSGFALTGRNIGPRQRMGGLEAPARSTGQPRQRPTGVRVSYPAMQRAQEPRSRARSPFVAAFLSLLFPGLGHAYAGAWQRALGFAAPPILIAALLAGIFLRMDTAQLIAFGLTDGVIPGVFIVNLLVLIYRLVAIVDAYRVMAYLNAFAMSGGGRLGRPRTVVNP